MIRWIALVLGLALAGCDSLSGNPEPALAATSRGPTAAAASPAPVSLQVARGLRALQQHGCTHCHEHDPADAPILRSSAAPRLQKVGDRVAPEFFERVLRDPAATTPSGTMPDLLRGLGDDERTAAIEALAGYLSTLGSEFRRVPPDAVAVDRGETLFHEVGCVACHDPQGKGDEPPIPIPDSHRFPDLVAKYSHSGLERFLRDPLTLRPSGRMPSLHLGDREASDIAHYLLRDTRMTGTLRYELARGHRRDFGDTQRVRRERAGLADGFDLNVPHPGGDYTLTFDGFLSVEQAGDYTFHLDVDDRGQLLIGEQLVIDLDNRKKGRKSGRGSIALEAGLHAIRLLYFQWVEDDALVLEWEGPGLSRGPIAADRLRSHRELVPPVTKREVTESVSRRGRALFGSLGCASCHNDLGVESTAPPAKRLRDLDSARGCLAPEPSGTTPPVTGPHYRLDAKTRSDIQAALAAIQAGDTRAPTAADRIGHTLGILNCLTCHDRDGRGGVAFVRRAFFATDEEDLGDEAKIPPTLSGVGDKLTDVWLRSVLVDGSMQRPYVKTRMPRFGEANVGHLIADFIAVDRKSTQLANPSDSIELLLEAGRALVDSEGLQCIGCHQFNRNPSVGMQALDVIPLAQRIRREWFHDFMRDPTALKPSTLMPDLFPGGKSLAPDILDGDMTRQLHAIWAYLSQGRKAIPPKGLSQQSVELIVGGQPVLYRGKLWEAGWRGIAVGYPELLNVAFDAEELRLALLWKGRFLNASAHFNSQGMGRIRPIGHSVVVFPHGPAVAELATADALWPEEQGRQPTDRFEGYTLDENRRPTFHYRVNGISIDDFFEDVSDTVASERQSLYLKRRLNFRGPSTSVTPFVRLWVGQSVTKTDAGYQCDDKLVIRTDGAHIRESRGEQELLVPIPIIDGEVDLRVEYVWGKKP